MNDAMKNIVLDFGKMANAGAVHDFLRAETSSEEYFGSNLDAMFDVLSTIGEETCITVVHGGTDFEEKFISVMKDAAEEQERLTISVQDPAESDGKTDAETVSFSEGEPPAETAQKELKGDHICPPKKYPRNFSIFSKKALTSSGVRVII